MKDRVLAFLADLDAALVPLAGDERLDLYHIGRSALAWQYGFLAATEDVDAILPHEPAHLVDAARRRFGKGTANAAAHGLYLEFVPPGLPPIPPGCRKRATEATGDWTVIRLFHLEPHDLAATKLGRFATKDRQDIRQMCDFNLLDPDRLEQVLDAAWYVHLEKDGNPKRDAAYAHLRRVQAYLRGDVTDL